MILSKQNVHEIEKIGIKPHAYEYDWHFENLQKSYVKFVKKKLLERKILKCIWKTSIKDLRKYKCDECGKNFTHNIGMKGHITAAHERKYSIVITVAKITQNTGLKSKIKEKEIINVITVENSILK